MATSGRAYMVTGIPMQNISNNASPKDSPDPLGNTPFKNELDSPQTRQNAKIILKAQYPTHIKPSHCTTINAGGFGSSFPPFTFALSAVLIIRTSPIIAPSFLLPAFLSHGRESGASSFRGTAQLLTQAKCRWHLHYVTVACSGKLILVIIYQMPFTRARGQIKKHPRCWTFRLLAKKLTGPQGAFKSSSRFLGTSNPHQLISRKVPMTHLCRKLRWRPPPNPRRRHRPQDHSPSSRHDRARRAFRPSSMQKPWTWRNREG